ncbi:TetR/AcrR family transcriptional regulator [Paenibacillus agilis]|uniref:TetR/AcrR family transcriptional regulator n=1 Tax=Paenibacillus agilis TaxID=3020863 RepID=A0A559J1T0_9BACL|nr:TetR/AcrR family transcriptional regulator [Paenibacillus agilis]TVX93845.1 TetR/AcrR family transcriptional regulator [Paenibacillus agilis]
MSKREQILNAASQVIATKGANQLTLDAVAAEAGVSKGGLLYHFPNKDELIKGLNIHVITCFRNMIEAELESGIPYSQAYLQATIKTSADPDFLLVNSSLIAAVSNNSDFLNLWAEEYERFHQAWEQEGLSKEKSVVLRTLCDGLWFSSMFQLYPVANVDQQIVFDYMMKLLREELS